MNYRLTIFASVIFLASALLASTGAEAVQRTHVSAAFGSDANTATNCPATAPCRFFQAAMSVTDSNGEVIVLDSGGYGAVTITKSVSLTAPTGVYAGISVFSGATGVNVTTAGINVVLRGLTINGQGGSYGIVTNAANNISIFNCEISNFSAIAGSSGVVASSGAKLQIVDSIIRNNYYGVLVDEGAKATISKVSFLGNSSVAVYAKSATAGVTTTVAISDSTVSDSGIGVYVYSTVANALARASVTRTALSGNNYALYSQGANSLSLSVGLITVSESMVTGNFYGLVQSGAGAVLRSLGNNTVDQNIYNTSGTISAFLPS